MSFRSIWYTAAVTAAVDQAGDRGVRDSGQELLERSLAVVPRLTNALADSAELSVENGEAAVSYTSPYAVKQHEDTTYRHQSGQSAKFLERPLDDGTPDLLAKIGLSLKRAMPRTRL